MRSCVASFAMEQNRGQNSLFLARAFNAQRRLWASLKALGCDFISAPHALTIGPVLNSRQRAHHGSDVTRDERSLPFKWNVLLHLDRLFREIGIERFSQVLCDAVLPFFEFHKLRLKTSFCGDSIDHCRNLRLFPAYA